MFFKQSDRIVLQEIHDEAQRKYELFSVRLHNIEDFLHRVPDIEKFCQNTRDLVAYLESNIKSLNTMMLELKGIIAKETGKSKAKDSKPKKK